MANTAPPEASVWVTKELYNALVQEDQQEYHRPPQHRKPQPQPHRSSLPITILPSHGRFAIDLAYRASDMISRWYIEWFYTWTIFVEAATTVLTSTTTTLYTTISIYDTNSAAAAASFSSVSQTISLPTPAVRTNPVPVGTSPAVPGSTHSSIPTSTSNVNTGSQTGHSTTSSGGGTGQSSSSESTTSSTSSSRATTPSTSPSSSSSSSSSKASTSSPSASASVGLSSSANALGAGWTTFWVIGTFVGVLIAPGFLMVWL
jgi:hypothetical protein